MNEEDERDDEGGEEDDEEGEDKGEEEDEVEEDGEEDEENDDDDERMAKRTKSHDANVAKEVKEKKSQCRKCHTRRRKGWFMREANVSGGSDCTTTLCLPCRVVKGYNDSKHPEPKPRGLSNWQWAENMVKDKIRKIEEGPNRPNISQDEIAEMRYLVAENFGVETKSSDAKPKKRKSQEDARSRENGDSRPHKKAKHRPSGPSSQSRPRAEEQGPSTQERHRTSKTGRVAKPQRSVVPRISKTSANRHERGGTSQGRITDRGQDHPSGNDRPPSRLLDTLQNMKQDILAVADANNKKILKTSTWTRLASDTSEVARLIVNCPNLGNPHLVRAEALENADSEADVLLVLEKVDKAISLLQVVKAQNVCDELAETLDVEGAAEDFRRSFQWLVDVAESRAAREERRSL